MAPMTLNVTHLMRAF